MFLVYRGAVFFVSTVGGYITLVLYMLCGCYMFVAVFGLYGGDFGAGFPSVKVCGVGYGSHFPVCQVRSSSGTFTEQVGGGLAWWWVVRVKFPDTLQSVVWDFMFCGLSRA
jgi:hypothetical protein